MAISASNKSRNYCDRQLERPAAIATAEINHLISGMLLMLLLLMAPTTATDFRWCSAKSLTRIEMMSYPCD